MTLRINTRNSLDLMIQFVYARTAKNPTVYVTNLDTAVTEALDDGAWSLSPETWEDADSVHVTVSTVRPPRDIELSFDVGHETRTVKTQSTVCELKSPPWNVGMSFAVVARGGGESHRVDVMMPAVSSARMRNGLTMGSVANEPIPPWKIPIILGGPTTGGGGGPKGWEDKLRALLPRGAESNLLHLIETLRDDRLARELEDMDESAAPPASRPALRLIRDLLAQLHPRTDDSPRNREG